MNSSSPKPVIVDLNIGDQLTSISCGHMVVELAKFIVYQRRQIPYTYQWLKNVVNQKKSSDKRDSFQSETHFRTVATALENLDFMLKSLLQEINSAVMPEEVCIALGTNPYKEVYRLLLPTVCHRQQCQSTHIASDQQLKNNVFKTLVTSEALGAIFFSSMPPTNLNVYIKKKFNDSQGVVLNQDNFVPTSGFRIPRTSKIVIIDFRSVNKDNLTCCNDFQIFGDTMASGLVNLQNEDDSNFQDFYEIDSNDAMKWYQSSYVMKGFKDCIVNGSSITNTWLES